jgi:homoserine O-acetyltransferase
MNQKLYIYNKAFALESGKELPGIEIAYHTYGELNADKSNVVWVCHALTANSDPADWWGILVGKGKIFDPGKHFIVCANILASCYGSSGPLTTDPRTKQPYYSLFPQVTIRDIVKAHILLREHLGIKKIHIAAGGSMGGYQLQEWAIIEPAVIDNMVLLTTSARESAWGIAIHTAQRLAIETDITWKDSSPAAGAKGLKTARAIGMLTYRNYETFIREQDDPDHLKTDDFKASSYIHYQGEKLVKRFNAQSYWLISKAMDSHNVGRHRESIEKALGTIKAKTLVISIANDMLCPTVEQEFLAKHIPNAKCITINSAYGHDGFLIEEEKISKAISDFL